MTKVSKIRTEKRIMKLSLIGSILFMVVEGAMAWFTHSHSILMDFIFDITDLIMIGPFLLLVPLLYKPVTERHPYGYSQVESLFLVIKYSVLLIVTGQLIIDNVQVIMDGGHLVNANAIALFEFFIFLGCLMMYVLMSHYSKRYESDTIRAELYIWKLDVISSIGVALAFFTQIILQGTPISWVTPYIDPVVAIIMSFLLIVEPVKMIGRSIKELVLFAPNKECMDTIHTVVDKKLQEYPYSIKFLDVIQTGRKTWVEIYISTPDDTIRTKELQFLRDSIKKALKPSFDQLYVELIPDIPE